MPVTGLLPPNLDVDSKRLAEPHLPSDPMAPAATPSAQARVPAHSGRKKWWLAITLVVIAAAVAVYYFRGPAEPVYQTAVVDRGDIQAAITATGAVNAVKTVQVGSQVSGNIIALYADFNTKVKKGQLVARIDPAIFQARVDQSNAVLESAKASVVSARASIARAAADIAAAQANVASQKANLVRAQSAVTDAKLKNERRIELVKQGIIAQEEADTFSATYDQSIASLDAAKSAITAAEASVGSARAQKDVAETTLTSAEAQVKQAAATLQQAQLDLSHTQIVAPVDGTVVSRNMDVGQTVAASFQAPTIFQIAQDLTKMQVDTNVDESDVAPIRVGQKAMFTVDAYPGTMFPGDVTQIRQAPMSVQNVVTYNVVVSLSNEDLKLFPGMTANVRIITGVAPNAVRLPAAALRFRPSTVGATNAKQTQTKTSRKNGARGQGPQIVYALAQGKLKEVPVKLGLSDGNFTEVLSGLEEGQTVVIGSAGAKTSAAATTPAAAPGGRRFGF